MNLIIDIGNTLTKIALFKGDEMIFSKKHKRLTSKSLSQLIKKYQAKRAIVSNVRTSSKSIDMALNQNIPTILFNHTTPIPIANCYATPHTLGPDRLAAAVGAHYLYPNSPVLAIDVGTTITYEFVSLKGEYLGGAISPGIITRYKSLHRYTKKLPLIEPTDDYQPIGDDTKSCIVAGVQMGILLEVDGYINLIKSLYPNVKIVFTGGDANFFDKKLKNSIFVNPNLVLLGLNRILNYNA